MAVMLLSNGYETLVDDADVAALVVYKWTARANYGEFAKLNFPQESVS